MEVSFCSRVDHPSLYQLASVQLDAWPEHEKFLTKRFASGDQQKAERLAGLVLRLTGGDPTILAADYRWTCDRLLEEELYFRRTGRYRLTSFAEAEREVYSNKEYMTRYMNGLLLSQIWWGNHTGVINYYVDEFLVGNPPGYRHLEVGPGHGLLLYFAANDARCSLAEGWELSEASLEASRLALRRLAPEREARLVRRSVFDDSPVDARYDSIVISEVCEHLEDPKAALEGLRAVLAPGGRLLVNMPVNSPAPDHLFLLRTPEEVVALVSDSGYDIEATRAFPVSGYSEARARKAGSTISCVVVARSRA
jgi:2-polyprenyl-3-methyl-5-hydroxy-6-metoxy-1,4-benzoquinol methylase